MLGKKKKIVQSHRCMEAGMCEIKEQEQFNVAKMRKFGKTREWQNIKLRGRLKLDQEFEFYFIGNAKLLNLGKESTHKDYREDSFSPSERVACRLERWIGEWKRVSLVVQCLVAQSCLTLCHPVDCSLPGSSVHAILQARILECVANPYSRGSSQPRDQTQVFGIAGRFFFFFF